MSVASSSVHHGAALGRVAVSGVILAGGRGARMGGADKGWVSWQGRALVERAQERFAPQVDELLISANRNLDRYRALGAEVVSDDAQRLGSYAGPAAGMLAGMRKARHEWVAFVPCDAPLLPLDLVARLRRAAEGHRAAVACCGGRMQPVFCLLARELAPQWEALLLGGENRPQSLLHACGAVALDFEDRLAFTNVNRMGDDGDIGDG